MASVQSSTYHVLPMLKSPALADYIALPFKFHPSPILETQLGLAKDIRLKRPMVVDAIFVLTPICSACPSNVHSLNQPPPPPHKAQRFRSYLSNPLILFIIFGIQQATSPHIICLYLNRATFLYPVSSTVRPLPFNLSSPSIF